MTEKYLYLLDALNLRTALYLFWPGLVFLRKEYANLTKPILSLLNLLKRDSLTKNVRHRLIMDRIQFFCYTILNQNAKINIFLFYYATVEGHLLSLQYRFVRLWLLPISYFSVNNSIAWVCHSSLPVLLIRTRIFESG